MNECTVHGYSIINFNLKKWLFSLCRLGPLVRSWCMRFEAKHHYFKRLAISIGNYTNITYSLAKRHQEGLCYLPASDSWRRNVFIHWKRNWNRDRLKKNNNNHNHWNTHTHILLSYLFVKLFAYCICNFSKITGNPCFLGDLNYGELIQAGTNANPLTQVTE